MKDKNSEHSEIFQDKNFVSFIHSYHKAKEKFDKSPKEIIKSLSGQVLLPISIFVHQLGCLEAIVKYLRENLNLGFREIAQQLKKSQANIRVSYSNSNKKHASAFETIDVLKGSGQIFVPVKIFSSAKFSMLEALVKFLKEDLELKFCEISKLIGRDQRTVWTVYRRAVSKKANSESFKNKTK